MTSIKYADVEISVPDGRLYGTSVIVNGMDLSRFTNAVEFSVNADGMNTIALVKLTLVANIKVNGKLAIETEALEGKVFNIE